MEGYRKACFATPVRGNASNGSGVHWESPGDQQGIASCLVHYHFMPCILADSLASLVPNNLRRRSSGYSTGETDLVAFHTGEVRSRLKESWSKGGFFRVAALAEGGVTAAPILNPRLRLGIWLKVMLTAQINNKIGGAEAVRHTR